MREFLISLCFGTKQIPKKYAYLYEQIKSCGAIQDNTKSTHKSFKNPAKSTNNFFKLLPTFGIFCVHKTTPKSTQKTQKISQKKLSKHSTKNLSNPPKLAHKNQLIFLQDITKKRNDIALMRQHIPTHFQEMLSDNDIVLALLVGKRGKEYVRIIKVLSSDFSHNQKRLVYLEKHQDKIIGIDLKNGEIYPLPFSQKSLSQLPFHCVLSYENAHKDNHKKPQIHKILGVLEDAHIDEKIALFLHGREEDFSAECRELAQSFGDRVEPSLYKNRVDLRGLDFISIDPSDAKDYDDVIFYDEKRGVLYVGIADVSEYVLPKTALDMEAKSRSFSLYFPHKCYPMLPQELSENLCSLKADEIKLAMVCEIEFGRAKNPKNAISCQTKTKQLQPHKPKSCKIYEAIIQPKANVSYEYIDTLLDALESSKNTPQNPSKNITKSPTKSSQKSNPNPIFAPLKSLKNPKWILDFSAMAQGLKKERLQNGFDFFTKERKMILDKNNEIKSIKEIYPTRSHSLIQEAMLLANVAVAQILDNTLEGRGIYRVHNPPTKDRLHALFAELALLGYEIKKQGTIYEQISALQSQQQNLNDREYIDKLIIKAQQEARYAPSKEAHFGLGFEAYSHFTSPIRRYSDILAHRLIKLLLQSYGGVLDFALDCANATTKITPKINQKIATKNTQKITQDFTRHINFVLDSIAVATPLLNDAERKITKCEMGFKDRKYARSALKMLRANEEICIRIIDERYPAIAVVESNPKSNDAKSSQNDNVAKSYTKTNLANNVLQGARVFVLDSDEGIEKYGLYLASIIEVELGSAKIYVKIHSKINDLQNQPLQKLHSQNLHLQNPYPKNPKATPSKIHKHKKRTQQKNTKIPKATKITKINATRTKTLTNKRAK